MPIVDYWLRASKLAFHDLTTYLTPPRNLRTLLGQGLKFIPTPNRTTRFSELQENRTGVTHLARSLRLACFFLSHPPPETTYNPRMAVPSDWMPTANFFPPFLSTRLLNFSIGLNQLFKPKKSKSNLSLPHRYALTYLRSQTDFLVVHCDKNLGPALIERDSYIRLAIADHLSDATTYRRLSQDDALQSHLSNVDAFTDWLRRFKPLIPPEEHKYLTHYIGTVKDPFPFFYILMKIQKIPLKSRPIVSYSGSFFYGLGVWVDHYLKQVAVTLRSYLKSSFELRSQLDALVLPPGRTYRLFTADAVSFYTNINTRAALNAIHTYIEDHPLLFPYFPLHALSEALEMIMTRNVFQFGDTFWHQLSGTAMGAPPAPSYATVSYGTFEEVFLDEYTDNLAFYRRYIDDIFGIWICDPDPIIDEHRWTTFQSRLNDWHGTTWIASPRSHEATFLDVTLTLRADHTISCSLFEKPQNLHLYLPPRSAHPPGMLAGVIAGTIYRCRSLCSNPADANAKIKAFWNHLLARGWTRTVLHPLFSKALSTVVPHLERAPPAPPTDPDTERLWLFKLRFHPQDPPSSAIRKIWEDTVASPPFGKPLANVDISYKPLGHRRFLVCYKRPPNLGNLLSYRKLKHNAGPPVSTFL